MKNSPSWSNMSTKKLLPGRPKTAVGVRGKKWHLQNVLRYGKAQL